MSKARFSAITNLNRLTKKLLVIASILTLFGVTVGIVLNLLARQQHSRIKNLRKELYTTQRSETATAQLRDFVSENQARLEQLNSMFPNQDTILDFIIDVETLIRTYDQDGSVRFESIKPTEYEQGEAIPITIQLRVDTTQLTEFLKQIEQLPYFIEVVNVKIASLDEEATRDEVVIGGRVYVNNSFN